VSLVVYFLYLIYFLRFLYIFFCLRLEEALA